MGSFLLANRMWILGKSEEPSSEILQCQSCNLHRCNFEFLCQKVVCLVFQRQSDE